MCISLSHHKSMDKKTLGHINSFIIIMKVLFISCSVTVAKCSSWSVKKWSDAKRLIVNITWLCKLKSEPLIKTYVSIAFTNIVKGLQKFTIVFTYTFKIQRDVKLLIKFLLYFDHYILRHVIVFKSIKTVILVSFEFRLDLLKLKPLFRPLFIRVIAQWCVNFYRFKFECFWKFQTFIATMLPFSRTRHL